MYNRNFIGQCVIVVIGHIDAHIGSIIPSNIKNFEILFSFLSMDAAPPKIWNKCLVNKFPNSRGAHQNRFLE